MLSLLFVFLAVSISANPVDHLLSPKKLFKDPKAFVSVFSRADKATIDRLIEMVAGLIQLGKDDLADATAIADAKTDAHATAEGELTDATTAVDEAKRDLEVKAGTASELTTQVAGHAATLEAATDAKALAEQEADEAATHKAKTITRVSDEKSDLDQILDFLTQYGEASVGFAEINRKLLEAEWIMVENESIDQIREMVEKLIKTGEDDEAAAVQADDGKQAEKNKAIDIYNAAFADHSASTGELEAAKLAKKQAENILETKESALVAATSKESNAAKEKDTANNALAEEKTRIDSEEATLAQINDLLQNLAEKAEE